MTGIVIPKTFRKVDTWGNPHHGLSINGLLTLSNGSTVSSTIDSSKRRFGDCHAIQVPGHTFTDTQPLGTHLKFEEYALSSGFEKKNLYNYRINHADKRQFIYCDDNKDRWRVTISPGVGGTATAITMGITLRKFGDFVGDDEVYTYTLNVGNPEITTVISAGYTYEVVNVNKNGNLAVIGLCLENSTTESQSTNIFDRQYGYPLAFIRLDLTSKTMQTASIYRSKTYCERTASANARTAFDKYYFYPKLSLKTELIKNSSGSTIRTVRTYGEYIDYSLKKNTTFIKTELKELPANTTNITYEWSIIYNYSYIQVGMSVGYPTGNQASLSTRLIHVFIKDDNSLVDVECQYISGGFAYQMYATKNKLTCENEQSLIAIGESIINSISDTRVKITGDITSSTGSVTISYSPSSYYYKELNKTEYRLLIGGTVVSNIIFNNNYTTSGENYYYNQTAAGVVTSNSPTTTYTDNAYTGPSAGKVTAVPLTGYKNYKGWMSKGTYTIDGSKYVTPFIQLYTNNLVGMIEGNYYTSNPDNAHWDTGSGGTMIALPIFNNLGQQVHSGGSIDALERYCSFHPINKTFSGLYDVPVCYV